MPNKLTAPFLLFGVALLFWCSAAGLSSILAGTVEKGDHGHPEAGVTRGEEPEEIKKLRSAAEGDPKAVGPRLELAGALHESAVEKKDNALLMDAVQAYQEVLALNADNPQALLGLANLCFEAGILDKALGYFERYLKREPGDFRAKTDYGLALIQANMLSEADAVLNEVVAAHPKLYQAHLALALAWKLQGRTADAEAKANEAKKLAPSDEDRVRIDSFLKSMSERAPSAGAPSAGLPSAGLPSAGLSPAGQVAAFFNGHPIVGPKVRGISWPELAVAKVKLDNFPVEQMPPFAREKFISGMKERLKNLPDKVQVKLYDAASDRELLSVDVGGGH